MSNSNSNITATDNARAQWTTKTGAVKTRNTATGAGFAPVTVRRSEALKTDLNAWVNGQYRGIVADTRNLLSDKDALKVAQACTLNPAQKPDVQAFLSAVLSVLTHKTNKAGEVVAPKGEKAQFVLLMQAIETFEVEQAARREVNIQALIQDDVMALSE